MAITYPLCGFILSTFSWEAVFYVTGVIGVIWFIFWWILVYDSPAQHPNISEKERNYIEKSLGQTVAKEKVLIRFWSNHKVDKKLNSIHNII